MNKLEKDALLQQMGMLIQKYNAMKGSLMAMNDLALGLENEINALNLKLRALKVDGPSPVPAVEKSKASGK